MADFKLHCFAQSGNAYKAALMLELTGSDWEPVFVNFFNGETRTQEYRAANVMGEVPILEHDGRSLSQTGVILDYLAEVTGQYGPNTPDERRDILRWMLFDNHKLTSYLATARFLHTFMDGADEAVVTWLTGRAKGALGVLNAHLDGRDYTVAERVTIADFSMCGYMYFGDELTVDIDAHFPNVARWRDRISDIDGWKHPYDLMPGHPLPPKDDAQPA